MPVKAATPTPIAIACVAAVAAPSGSFSPIRRETMAVVDMLATSGVVKSKGEARRQIQQGGISVNGKRATDSAAAVRDFGEPLAGRYYWIRRGKKTHAIIESAST